MASSSAWRGRGRYGSGRGARQATAPRAPSPPVGVLLQTLSTTVEGSQAVEPLVKVAIADPQCIASYNWLDSRAPTIVIPGCPPLWSPPANSPSLKQDSGSYYRDPNAARFPPHPLEPAVRAVVAENAGMHFQDIDIFACSSTLGSLLRCVRQVDKPFRFFVEAVGQTVFLTRHENTPTEVIPDVRGYGHTFPEAYTSWDAEVKGSASHQRLLQYDLGGLQCIVRFECDGCLESKLELGSSNAKRPTGHDTGKVTDLLVDLDVGPRTGKGGKAESLQVSRAGRRIPQASVFDLKTRAAWKADNVLEEELPRFWVAQIPTFILARHERGVFLDIDIVDVSEKVEHWQEQSQGELRRLMVILDKIISVARERADKKLEVRYRDVGTLELREQATSEYDTLPLQLRRLWMGDDDASEEHSTAQTPAVQSSHLSALTDGKHSPPGTDAAGADFTACSVECSYCGRCSKRGI